MLTWSVMIALALGVYVQRLAGAVLIDAERLSPAWRRVLDALPLAIISAVVALATFSEGGQLKLDARIAGVVVAALCANRRMPMLVTVIAAAVTTAAIRSLAWG